MEIINLNIDTRQKKDNVKDLRKNGFIPGIIYGKHSSPVSISLNSKEFYKTFAKTSISSFISVNSDKPEINGKTAVIKEIQKDPVKDNVIHIDFHEVSMNEKIEIEAALNFVGKAEGIKMGGILEPLMRHIVISGFPKDIVYTINVDVTELQVGDILHAGDLKIGDGLELITDPETAVVMVAEPTVEEETQKTEEEQPKAAEQPAAAKSQPQSKKE
ncbi:MAG: 50S ribosomal protein L25 [Candidatus Acididesulfobacter guangdongensis]|uniref:Large ribosomal subunit protein bL25 n=1 Tax=Acididesulfobacter guangdongensis TaxID=2597225 RepID=A0A519BI13_ACIG2|nr:MAG: 50S ribosomal protein L25 [Candidatus Acididesulfobacter guangdongensis]